MNKQRKHYSPQEKVRILREHLVEKAPVCDLCDRHGLRPNLFYHLAETILRERCGGQIGPQDD